MPSEFVNLAPQKGVPDWQTASHNAVTTQAAPNAYLQGAWSSIFNWLLIAIHSALLPNGQVFSFGSAPQSQFNYLEFEAFHHDVWDRKKQTRALS